MENPFENEPPFDIETAHAIRAAAIGMREGDPTLGQSLAAILRSDAPLTAADRETLALLVTDELLEEKKRGRPPVPKVKEIEQRRAVAEYVERTDAGDSAESVANDIYTRLKVRRSTFFQWVDEIRPVILQLEAMGLDGLEIMKSNQNRE